MNSFFLIVIGLSMALFTSKAGADTRGECRCEYSWQHAYAEYINDLEYYSGLYIGDLNGDEIPEAVIDVNTLGSVIVLYDTREGRKELNLETVSAWGSVTYIADTGQFLYFPFTGIPQVPGDMRSITFMTGRERSMNRPFPCSEKAAIIRTRKVMNMERVLLTGRKPTMKALKKS